MYYLTAERSYHDFPDPMDDPVIVDETSCPEDGCLTSFMNGLSGQLGAQGLLVACHHPAKEPSLMFRDGACKRDSEIERMLLDCAVQSLAEVTRPMNSLSCRDRLASKVVTAKLVLSDFAITITGLMKLTPRASGARVGERLARLLPVTWPFLRMWAQRERLDRRLEGLEAALEKSEIATLLLSDGGRVIFANRSGRALLEAGRGVRSDRRNLAGPSLAETLRLRAAIEHLSAADRTDASVTPILAIPRRNMRPLMITLDAIAKPGGVTSTGTVIAHLFDPEDELATLIDPACRFYGLSPSETRLTRAIAEGQPLATAAASIGVREQTARSYLKQIFLKTETNRQAELVALMLRSAVRLAPHSRTQVF